MTEEKKEDSPAGVIGAGLLFIALGVGLYFLFDYIETEGGRVRMPVILIFIYGLLGKWGILCVVGGLGLLGTLVGIKDLISGKPSAEGAMPEAKSE